MARVFASDEELFLFCQVCEVAIYFEDMEIFEKTVKVVKEKRIAFFETIHLPNGQKVRSRVLDEKYMPEWSSTESIQQRAVMVPDGQEISYFEPFGDYKDFCLQWEESAW